MRHSNQSNKVVLLLVQLQTRITNVGQICKILAKQWKNLLLNKHSTMLNEVSSQTNQFQLAESSHLKTVLTPLAALTGSLSVAPSYEKSLAAIELPTLPH